MTTPTPRLRRLVAGVAALAALTAIPHAALADEPRATHTAGREARERPDTIEQAKERALAAIDKRIDALSRMSERVAASEHITAAHAAHLQNDYRSATRGLTDLADEIAAAGTLEELRDLVPLIAQDYRVYLVVLPKSHEVLVSDAIADAVERMQDAADRLLEAIERAESEGIDMTEARRWLDIAQNKVAAAEAGGVLVADSVIDLTAADWEEPAKTLLDAGKRSLEAAREDVREAIDALKETKAAIGNALG